MATNPLTYSISSDFGGSFNPKNFGLDIQDPINGVERSFSHITTDGDVIEVNFVGDSDIAQSDVEKIQGADYPTTIGGLIASHDITPIDPEPESVSIEGVEVLSDGMLHVHPSPRPSNMSTYFSSVSDNTGVGDGSDLLIFNMTISDSSKSIDIVYSDLVYIKDGFVACQNAPLGSLVSAEVYDPTGTTKIGAFVYKAALLDTMPVPFDTEDKGTLPAGYILRLTVYNSNGTGDQDAAADFKAIARVEMFRSNTV